MNKLFILLYAILLTTADSIPVFSQKAGTSASRITASDLESHVSFLASPLLKGRMNGEEGLEIAAQYIISQARLLGLKPANGNSFLQPYLIEKKSIDKIRTKVQIFSGKKDSVTLTEPVFQLFPAEISDRILEGEVIFAGYGLKLVNYNDFENLKTDGKILLIMDSGPPSEDGKGLLTGNTNLSSFMSIQSKISALLYSGAKAIIIVANPISFVFLLSVLLYFLIHQLSREIVHQVIKSPVSYTHLRRRRCVNVRPWPRS